MEEDTIVAPATPVGVGAIGIIRLSGPEAIPIASRCFHPAKELRLEEAESHKAIYASVIDPETGVSIDEAIFLVMRKPHSYTGEDVVEIHCHGSPAVLRRVMEVVTKSGARVAEPGEFTKRAFLNGRMDLAQAESVAELITSQTEQARKVALAHLQGQLSTEISEISRRLYSTLAALEVVIDYAEEDVEEVSTETLKGTLQEVESLLQKLLGTYREGKILREGALVVIVGKPNVGKSSLLNALLRQERAIVTPIPGTTRDYIEETVEMEGIPIRLTDTAGLRPSSDVVEQMGTQRALSLMDQADLLLLLLDSSSPLTAEDQEALEITSKKLRLLVLNKVDLPANPDTLLQVEPWNPIRISAFTGEGLDVLKKEIVSSLLGKASLAEHTIITLERHRDILQRSFHHLQDAQNALTIGYPRDVVATAIRASLDALSELTGENVTDEILNTIFSTFCVGK